VDDLAHPLLRAWGAVQVVVTVTAVGAVGAAVVVVVVAEVEVEGVVVQPLV